MFKWFKFFVFKNSVCICFDIRYGFCLLILYNIWLYLFFNDFSCYLLLLLFMFINFIWIRSVLEWNFDISIGCLLLILVNETYRRFFTISWALFGNMEFRIFFRILEISKFGCNGFSVLERVFVVSRSIKLVYLFNKKKWYEFDIFYFYKLRFIYCMNI